MEKHELIAELTKKAQEYLAKIGRAEAKPDEGWDDDGAWVEDDGFRRVARWMGASPVFRPHHGLAYVLLVRDHRHGGLFVRAKQEENGVWTLETMPETRRGE